MHKCYGGCSPLKSELTMRNVHGASRKAAPNAPPHEQCRTIGREGCYAMPWLPSAWPLLDYG